MPGELTRLAVDFENSSQVWWNEGGRELWEALIESFESHEVVLDTGIAESWLAQAAQIPGWGEGPEFAPHPIRISEIHEDEIL